MYFEPYCPTFREAMRCVQLLHLCVGAVSIKLAGDFCVHGKSQSTKPKQPRTADGRPFLPAGSFPFAKWQQNRVMTTFHRAHSHRWSLLSSHSSISRHHRAFNQIRIRLIWCYKWAIMCVVIRPSSSSSSRLVLRTHICLWKGYGRANRDPEGCALCHRPKKTSP